MNAPASYIVKESLYENKKILDSPRYIQEATKKRGKKVKTALPLVTVSTLSGFKNDTVIPSSVPEEQEEASYCESQTVSQVFPALNSLCKQQELPTSTNVVVNSAIGSSETENEDLKEQIKAFEPDMFYAKMGGRASTSPCLSTVTEESLQKSIGRNSVLSTFSDTQTRKERVQPTIVEELENLSSPVKMMSPDSTLKDDRILDKRSEVPVKVTPQKRQLRSRSNNKTNQKPEINATQNKPETDLQCKTSCTVSKPKRRITAKKQNQQSQGNQMSNDKVQDNKISNKKKGIVKKESAKKEKGKILSTSENNMSPTLIAETKDNTGYYIDPLETLSLECGQRTSNFDNFNLQSQGSIESGDFGSPVLFQSQPNSHKSDVKFKNKYGGLKGKSSSQLICTKNETYKPQINFSKGQPKFFKARARERESHLNTSDSHGSMYDFEPEDENMLKELPRKNSSTPLHTKCNTANIPLPGNISKCAGRKKHGESKEVPDKNNSILSNTDYDFSDIEEEELIVEHTKKKNKRNRSKAKHVAKKDVSFISKDDFDFPDIVDEEPIVEQKKERKKNKTNNTNKKIVTENSNFASVRDNDFSKIEEAERFVEEEKKTSRKPIQKKAIHSFNNRVSEKDSPILAKANYGFYDNNEESVIGEQNKKNRKNKTKTVSAFKNIIPGEDCRNLLNRDDDSSSNDEEQEQCHKKKANKRTAITKKSSNKEKIEKVPLSFQSNLHKACDKTTSKVPKRKRRNIFSETETEANDTRSEVSWLASTARKPKSRPKTYGKHYGDNQNEIEHYCDEQNVCSLYDFDHDNSAKDSSDDEKYVPKKVEKKARKRTQDCTNVGSYLQEAEVELPAQKRRKEEVTNDPIIEKPQDVKEQHKKSKKVKKINSKVESDLENEDSELYFKSKSRKQPTASNTLSESLRLLQVKPSQEYHISPVKTPKTPRYPGGNNSKKSGKKPTNLQFLRTPQHSSKSSKVVESDDGIEEPRCEQASQHSNMLASPIMPVSQQTDVSSIDSPVALTSTTRKSSVKTPKSLNGVHLELNLENIENFEENKYEQHDCESPTPRTSQINEHLGSGNIKPRRLFDCDIEEGEVGHENIRDDQNLCPNYNNHIPVEVAALINSAKVDMQRKVREKMHVVEQCTNLTVQSTGKKIKKCWEEEFVKRENVYDSYNQRFVNVLKEIEHDVNETKITEEKISASMKEHFTQLHKCHAMQQKGIQNLNDVQQELSDELCKLGYSKKTNNSIHETVRKEMTTMQRNILRQSQKQEILNVKNSLKAMFL